jgi:hypothetical protein
MASSAYLTVRGNERGLPVPVLIRQFPPRAASTLPEQGPVGHHPVITPAVAPGGHHRRQPLPFLITEIMPTQAIIQPP